MKKFIYYLPRILTILIAIFFSIFILEGFGPGFSWVDSLMHFLFAVVVLAAAITAWKWPKIGGWFFLFFGVNFLLPPSWNGLIVGGAPFIAGILFLIEGFKKQGK